MDYQQALNDLKWKDFSSDPPDDNETRILVRIQPEGQTPFCAPCMWRKGSLKIVGPDGFLMHHAPVESMVTGWSQHTDNYPAVRNPVRVRDGTW